MKKMELELKRDSKKMVQVKVRIYGQVQGVFFRHSAKREAERLGLVGWVKNNDDGSVEVLAQGPKDKLEEFVAWCKKGPPSASVEDVEVSWSRETDAFGSFEIIN